GDVTGDLREAKQAAQVIAQGGDDDVRLETGAVLADAPAFVLRATVLLSQLEVQRRAAASDIARSAETGQWRALDFIGAIAEQPLRAGVPTGHPPGGVEHKDRIVLHTLHEQPEPLLALLQCLLIASTFADVAEG